MVFVMEVWYFKPGLEENLEKLMQEMDEIVGPIAHADPGWREHAHFYQSHFCPSMAIMLYHWGSIEQHKELMLKEEPLLKEFYEKHCTRSREIQYFNELENQDH